MTHDELLREYAKKPVRTFIQIDGFSDGDMGSDSDGDNLWLTATYELRNCGHPLRIQVAEGSDTEVVLRLLAKAYAWIAKDGLDAPSPDPEPKVLLLREDNDI